MKLFAGSIIVCLCLIAASSVGEVSAQAKTDKLRIGYAARAVAHSVPFVAKEAGFFAEEGINAEIIHTAGSIAPMALVANEVDMTIMSAYLMIPVSVLNRDIVMLGGFSRYATMVFVARPDNEEPRRKQRGIRSNRSNNRSKLRGINPIEIKCYTSD